MPIGPTRVALAMLVLVAIGFTWRYGGRDRWRALVADRFVYGVPWGTLLTVGIVVAFYLFAQGGLRHWGEPLTYPFITWSYLYPTGWLTAGIAHGSPEHLVANMTGTLAFAPIAEYAWGHYPSRRTATNADDTGLLKRPWFRAVVAFPAALLAAAYLTAFFSLGPGLGFSGAVFAIAGFALVTYPLAAVVGVLASSGLQLLYQALTQPVVREAVERGPPTPPEWAGIGFQAHLLGFLVGVLLGIALLQRRSRRPSPTRLVLATALFGLVQSLWLLVFPVAEDVFALYRGAGVVLVLALALGTTVAVAGSDRPLPRVLPIERSTRRRLAGAWLAVLALVALIGTVGLLVSGQPVLFGLGTVLLVAALLALPALPSVVPDRVLSSPLSRRQTAIACLGVLTLLVAVPSIPFGLTVVGDDAVPGAGEVEVEGYAVTYEQNATIGQDSIVDVDGANESETRRDGVVLVNADREISTVTVRSDLLEYAGEGSVDVGGFGWRETIAVERTGWDVTGNETAYAVDLEVDDETTRSFVSDPVRAHATVDGQTFHVVPDDEAFLLRVTEDGTDVGETAIPSANETATVGDLQVSTEEADGIERVIVETDGTEVQIAQQERYAAEEAAEELEELEDR
ncbi:rhomboid family intramembrane serine protease [Natronococcus sp. A-GB7]|uniref:rhomboid family intramembrane serine protease n=1 Tax=Natronococcus sp. A-GB7 TaxID=3037649 RepID=UPI00241D46B0|nr:rhomboid family intramembrane serine protease [Natronococcus sp. A-GB7]MDG5817763.1 rhomboid family intramembrane serine protease [Natronococcus sp. A-GB7]